MNTMQAIKRNNARRVFDERKTLMDNLKPVILEMRANFRCIAELREELRQQEDK